MRRGGWYAFTGDDGTYYKLAVLEVDRDEEEIQLSIEFQDMVSKPDGSRGWSLVNHQWSVTVNDLRQMVQAATEALALYDSNGY